MFFERYKKVIIGLAILFVAIVIIVLITILTEKTPTNRPTNRILSPTPIPIPSTFQESPPKITNVFPRNNQTDADYTGVIRVSFNTAVRPEWFFLSFTPRVEGTLERGTSNNIIFKPSSPLEPNTQYRATVALKSGSIISPQNVTTDSYTWLFTTDQITGEEAFNETDKETFRTMREAAEKSFADRKKRFPFIMQLPKQTMHYKIEISGDTIIITTYGNNTYQTQLARQDAQDWLRANGGNPSALTIQYKTQ